MGGPLTDKKKINSLLIFFKDAVFRKQYKYSGLKIGMDCLKSLELLERLKSWSQSVTILLIHANIKEAVIVTFDVDVFTFCEGIIEFI